MKHELTAHGIYKIFTKKTHDINILNNISTTFTSGNTYAITGSSGSGKSTLMHILAGLDTPTHGNVFFNNNCLQTMSPLKHTHFLNKSIGLVFQSSHLIRELSVIENIILPGLISGQNKENCEKKASELLHTIHLSHKKHSKPGELSGGQQQRVAIARALFNEPAFLIADEPTGNLDLTTGRSILELLLTCHQTWGMGLIISSHDKYIANTMDKTYELHEGTLHTLR